LALPGPAWPRALTVDMTGRVRDQHVLGNHDGTSLPMLVPAGRSADVVTAPGRPGSLNHTEDMASLSAVLRSWGERFGARL
jgi:Domain of unknown function (DUF4253)